MKLLNESPFKAHDVRRLLKFVEQYADKEIWKKLFVHVVQQYHRNDAGFGGWSSIMQIEEQFKIKMPENYTCYIRIEHSDQIEYPFVFCRQKAVGPLIYDTWQQFFVATLAHEYEHIRNMWDHHMVRGLDYSTIKHSEVAAERYARWILLDYKDRLIHPLVKPSAKNDKKTE